MDYKSEIVIKRPKLEPQNDTIDSLIDLENENFLDETPKIFEILQNSPERRADFIELMKRSIIDQNFFNNQRTIYEMCQKYIEERFTTWAVDRKFHDESSNLSSFIETLEQFSFDIIDRSDSILLTLQIIMFNWIYESKIAFGLLQQVGSAVDFSMTIFRDYFAASLALRILETNCWGNAAQFCRNFIKFLTFGIFQDIRFMINEGLNSKWEIFENLKFMSKSTKSLAEKFVQSFNDPEDIVAIYSEDLANVIHLVSFILQHGSYEETSKFIKETFVKILVSIKTVQSFENYVNFTFNFLNENDLKILLVDQKIFHKLLASDLFPEVAKFLETKFNQVVHKFSIRQSLVFKINEISNIFFMSVEHSIIKPKKFKVLLEIVQNYCTSNEIFAMLTNSFDNLLHYGQYFSSQIFEEVFFELEKYFGPQKFLSLFEQKIIYSNKDRNALQHFYFGRGSDRDLNTQAILWDLVFKYYDTPEKLKNLLTETNMDDNNFMHILVLYNTPRTIKYVLSTLKNKLSSDDFHELLNTTGAGNRNLLQKANEKYTEGKAYDVVWEFVRDFCRSTEEFKHFINYKDSDRNTYLHVLVTFSRDESALKYVIDEIVKIFPLEDVQDLLSCTNKTKEILLQTAVRLKSNIEIHKVLWKAYYDFFKPYIITKLARHTQRNSNHLMHMAVTFADIEVIEYTWNEIKKVMDSDDQWEYLKMKGCKKRSLYENCCLKTKYPHVKDWVKNLLEDYEIL